MTDEEWEKEKASIIECGEGDLVPDPEGDFTVRLGTSEDVETFEQKQAEDRAKWKEMLGEEDRKEISELAALMRE
jgi:hypothetical protein